MARRPGIAALLKYKFDNFMSKGGGSIFVALLTLFFTAFLLMSAVRFAANYFLPDETIASFTDQLWRVFLQISDAGAVAEDGDSSAINKVVGIVTIFLGLILFSSLVAFITSQFEQMLAELKKGKSRVIEQNHTLILGFSDRVLEIIRELVLANESERDAAVVVLADEEKDMMDDYFRERAENLRTTRIITRSGVTSSIQTLEKMSLSEAKSIIILNDVQPDAEDCDKELADARVIKTIMAVAACAKGSALPPIVAEIHMENKRRLAKSISDRVYLIEEHSLLAKLIVQTSRISGLALVYDSLVGFDGCEFYFYGNPSGWRGKTYGELQLHFAECSVLGIRTENGTVQINPAPNTVIADSTELLLIAEDDSVIKFNKKPFKTGKIDAAPAVPQEKKPEQQLVVGWSKKAAILVDEYAEYLAEGSAIDVLIGEHSDTISSQFTRIKEHNPSISMRLIELNPHEPGALYEIAPEKYNNVIILKEDGGDPELRDSETISLLLQFRNYLKMAGTAQSETQLISEVADSDNLEVILEVGVNDFLISNKFISKLYAQVSEDPDVLKVYEDLFSEEGSEIYIKPLSLFLRSAPLKVRFGDLCLAAQMRGESCFGVRIMQESENPDTNYGIYINPPKDQVFKLNLNDCLLTLAEDEC